MSSTWEAPCVQHKVCLSLTIKCWGPLLQGSWKAWGICRQVVLYELLLREMGNIGCLTWNLSLSLWVEKSSQDTLHKEPNLSLSLFDLEQVSKLFSFLSAWDILLVHGDQWGDENKGWSGTMRQILLMVYSLCYPGNNTVPWCGVIWGTICVCESLVWEEKDFQKICANVYILPGEDLWLGSH